MIDIHSHILPAIDDGSSSIEKSILMAKMAYEHGTRALVATPHCNIPNLFNNYKSIILLEFIEEFKNTLQQNNIPLKIISGMEVYVTDDIFLLYQTDKLITINNSRYLLIEFKFDEDPLYAENIVKKLCELKIVPIIAHPERYTFALKDPGVIYRLILKGALIQVNRGSILGQFGSEVYSLSQLLLSRNLVHFIASDGHSLKIRRPIIDDAYCFLAENYSKEYAKLLVYDNPYSVLLNKYISHGSPTPPL